MVKSSFVLWSKRVNMNVKIWSEQYAINDVNPLLISSTRCETRLFQLKQQRQYFPSRILMYKMFEINFFKEINLLANWRYRKRMLKIINWIKRCSINTIQWFCLFSHIFISSFFQQIDRNVIFFAMWNFMKYIKLRRFV